MANHFSVHRRSIVFILGLILLFWLFYDLRSVLLPFFVGIALANILLPVIWWLEKRIPVPARWEPVRRIALIFFLFIVILGTIALLIFYLISTIADSFSNLISNAALYTESALRQLQEELRHLRDQMPVEMQQQIDVYIQQISDTAGNVTRDFLLKSMMVIPSTIGLIFGFAALPLFLFYILKDFEKLRDSFYAALSPWAAKHARNVAAIVGEVLGRYLRSQAVLGTAVGTMVLIGLLILRVDFAIMLALFAGLTEVVPTVGPWLGGSIAVIVTLATQPEKAIWVAVLFVVVQITENTLLVPRIHSAYLRVHPAAVVVLIVVGAYIAGFWGLVLAVPLTTTIVKVYSYFHQVAHDDDHQQE